MKPRHFWITVLMSVGCASQSTLAAVQPLVTLSNPTLQTLIDLGDTPVSVGNEQFSNFGLLTALPRNSAAPGQIRVLPVITDSGSGLQFVSNWFADNGANVNEVILFTVQPVDPTRSIVQINLMSDGTAVVPAVGTSSSTTLMAQLFDEASNPPVISTFNDGHTFPTDTTQPDINYAQVNIDPQTLLHITDTIIERSTAAAGNVAGGAVSHSIVQNVFVNVPEPAPVGWLCMPVIGLMSAMGRRRRRRAIEMPIS